MNVEAVALYIFSIHHILLDVEIQCAPFLPNEVGLDILFVLRVTHTREKFIRQRYCDSLK